MNFKFVTKIILIITGYLIALLILRNSRLKFSAIQLKSASFPDAHIIDSVKKEHFNKRNTNIISPHDFSYLINPNEAICQPNLLNNPLRVIAVVPSSVDNFKGRLMIRNTWGNQFLSNKLKVVFMTGLSANETINKLLKLEMKAHGDIVQEDFFDTYRNLTLKTLMALKWVSKYCYNVDYMLKIDDDVILNTNHLFDYLEYIENGSKLNRTIMGNLIPIAYVLRNNSSKWYISYEEYEENSFPAFCEGPAYLMSSDIIQPLFNLSLYVKTLSLEDVFIGILAKKMGNVSLIGIYDQIISDKYYAVEWMKSADVSNLLFVYTKDIIDYYYIWNTYFVPILIFNNH